MKKNQAVAVKILSALSMTLTIVIIIYLIGFILINGGHKINSNLIFSMPKGMPLGKEGGVYPAIIGSLSFGAVAIISSGILSLSVSLYTCFYCESKKMLHILRTIIGILAGIPSIVLALFGYGFFVVQLNFGLSILSGGLVLGIMIFPYIEIRLEKIFLEVDRQMLLASYALGINKTHTIFTLVLPQTLMKIISSFCLGLSLALGASAPILITGAITYGKIPKSIMSPAMALPVHLYYLIAEGVSTQQAYKTAFILITILLFLNLIPFIFSGKTDFKHRR